MFALTALLLTGVVQTEAGKVLTYDFKTIHSNSNLRIDQGFRTIEGNFAYWSGQYGGLFGRKITFATDSYPVLHMNGGLVDYHPSRKTYVMSLGVGDKVTFYYTGVNAKVSFHISGGAQLQGMQLYDILESGSPYTVTTAGNLSVLTHWSADGDETFINKIVVETANDYESVDISDGLCTYCSGNPLDFSSLSSVKAFVATGYEDGKFTFQQVKYVPANTGFLIVRDGGNSSSVNIPIGRSGNYKENLITGNMFRGCLQQKSIEVNDNERKYVLGKADGNIALYLMSRNFQCKSGKAYIAVPQ